MENKESLSCI